MRSQDELHPAAAIGEQAAFLKNTANHRRPLVGMQDKDGAVLLAGKSSHEVRRRSACLMVRDKSKRFPTEFGFPGEAFAGAGMELAQARASVAADPGEALEIVPGTRQDACFSRSEPFCQFSQPCGLTRCSAPASDTFRIGAQQCQLTRQRSTVSGTLAPVAEEHLSCKCHSAAAAPFTERAIRAPPGADPKACRDQEIGHCWQHILQWGC
jgi:hypothetical protein